MGAIVKEARENPRRFLERHFRECGLLPIQPESVFWKNLRKKHGSIAKELIDVIERRSEGDLTVCPNPIKNSGFNFANAVASQFDATKMLEVGLWLIESGIKCSTILDVGCDNGIFTCLLARLFPSARVVGVDPCREAIDLARKRAESLKASNVEFVCQSIDEYGESIAVAGPFDAIFAIAVFHEIANQDDRLPDAFSLEEAEKQIQNDEGVSTALKTLVGLLDKDGHFISVDRWATSSELLRWIRWNERAGLFAGLEMSHPVRFTAFHGQQDTLQLTCFSRNPSSHARIRDILSLHSKLDFRIQFPSEIKGDALSELIYGALDKDEPLSRITATYYDGSGIMQVVLGNANGIGYIYKTTSTGHRSIHLFPSIELAKAVGDFKLFESELSEVCDIEVS